MYWVFAYPPLLQHVIHRRWIDVILDHDPSEWDADQMTGFPLGDWSSGAVTTQQFIIGWFQSRRPCWSPVCGRKAQLSNSDIVKTALDFLANSPSLLSKTVVCLMKATSPASSNKHLKRQNFMLIVATSACESRQGVNISYLNAPS